MKKAILSFSLVTIAFTAALAQDGQHMIIEGNLRCLRTIAGMDEGRRKQKAEQGTKIGA